VGSVPSGLDDVAQVTGLGVAHLLPGEILVRDDLPRVC